MSVVGFHDVRFPTGIAYASVGGTEFRTEVIEGSDGVTYRNVLWSQDRERWNIGYIKSIAQFETLRTFHRARRGAAYGFRLKNPDDYQAVGEVIGTGDGEEVDFQLVKTYSDAGGSFERKITRPILATVRIYIDSVESTSGWTLDDETGIVSFDSGSTPGTGEVISWDGDFDIPAHFVSDYMPETLEAYNVRSAEVVIQGLKE